MGTLLAMALVLQDKSADETFKKIEETIGKAKTLSVKFTYSDTHGDDKTEGRGTLEMKDGNRLRLLHSLRSGGRDFAFNIHSDGSTLTLPLGQLPEPRRVPKTLKKGISRAIARAGLTESWFPLRRATAAESVEEVETNLENLFEVFDVKFAVEEGAAQALTYGMLDATSKCRFTAQLWYNPKTHIILKRTLERSGSKGPIRSTETYEEFALDVEIPDEKFKLPDPK